MQNLLRLALLLPCLAACATAPSRISACPHVREYDRELMATAADELDALPDGSVLANVMMPDYAAIRAGARECAK